MKKLNIKDILIIVLAILSVVLLLAFIFKPNQTVITNQDIIDSLNIENRNLIILNDSIIKYNIILNQKIDSIDREIDYIESELDEANYRIDTFKNKKDEISIRIDTISSDELKRAFSEFFSRRK
jgi:hypothetical protein